jgi:hypothetical protein
MSQPPPPSGSVEEHEARFRKELTHCINCQVRDSGEWVWIHGSKIYIEELFDWLEVSESMRDDIVDRVDCPWCGSPLERTMDVGIRHDFERAHDERLNEARDRYEDELWDFVHHLEAYPFLGASHELGQRIAEMIDEFPTLSVEDHLWHRARAIRSGREFGPEDLLPPNPDEVDIPAGRYHHPGQPQWYLASEPAAAVAEVTTAGEQMAWVQDFRVRQLDNVLDLRSWTPHDRRAFDEYEDLSEFPLIAIALVFSDTLTQRSDDESGQQHSEHYPSRYVADLARLRGNNGILFRSARHLDENLVIFDPAFECGPVGEPEIVELSPMEVHRRDKGYTHDGFPVLTPGGSLPLRPGRGEGNANDDRTDEAPDAPPR